MCVQKYDIVKILVGENATRLAVKVLSNVAEGRGGTLPLDMVCWITPNCVLSLSWVKE